MSYLNLKQWSFPAGERGVKLENEPTSDDEAIELIRINFNFKNSDSLIDLLLTVDAIKRQYRGVRLELNCPYFPYARQDRKTCDGESHSLKVIAKLINDLNFETVYVVDPHSDVLEALVDNLHIKTQLQCIATTYKVDVRAYDYIIAPDAGALKKIYKIATHYKKPVVCAAKQRNLKTGEVSGIIISSDDFNAISGKKCLVVDDICDGGTTFIELAKCLPKDVKLDLFTTHGIYSKGKKVLEKHYTNIFCYNDMSVENSDTISLTINPHKF